MWVEEKITLNEYVYAILRTHSMTNLVHAIDVYQVDSSLFNSRGVKRLHQEPYGITREEAIKKAEDFLQSSSGAQS